MPGPRTGQEYTASHLRQSLYNWGKSTQALFHISINPYFRVKKSCPTSPQNNKEKMVRSWVELEKHQYKQLKELQENTGRPVSEMIREAISNFVRKKGYSISIGPSHLPREARENYRRVTTYLSRSDLSLLKSISKETGRCKTHLIREAVDEYLGDTAVQGKRKGKASNDDWLS